MADKKVLITGVSSGIGRVLTKSLIKLNYTVWGVARRQELLLSLAKEISSTKFFSSRVDISTKSDWEKLVKKLINKKFIPDVIIFNAAILENDLGNGFDIESTEKMISTNFYGAMRGIALLLPKAKPGSQFIAISSLSALKGSGIEGVGYAASKAALSIAFESLHQRYKDIFSFKTIYFGPITGGMSPFKKKPPFAISEEAAVRFIIKVMEGKNIIYLYPKLLFTIYRFIRLLPSNLYFKLLSKHEDLRTKFRG